MSAACFLIGDSRRLGWNTNYKIPLKDETFTKWVVTKKRKKKVWTKNKKTLDKSDKFLLLCVLCVVPRTAFGIQIILWRDCLQFVCVRHRLVNFEKDVSFLGKTKSAIDSSFFIRRPLLSWFRNKLSG